MRNKTTNVYTEWLPLIETLTDEQAGIIFKSILQYQNGCDVSCENPIWLFIKSKIDNYNEDLRNKSNFRSEAGRLGGLAKASNAKQHLATPSKPSIKENKIKENKIKENKIKQDKRKEDIIDNGQYNISDNLKKSFTDWLDYKKSKGQSYKNDKSIETCYKKLMEFAINDEDKAIKI